VCEDCGVILGQLMLHNSSQLFDTDDDNNAHPVKKYFHNVSKENHFPHYVARKSFEVWTTHFSSVRSHSQLYRASIAYSLYEALFYADIAYTMQEVARITGVDVTKMIRVEKKMNLGNNTRIRPEHLIERYACILNIEYIHIKFMLSIVRNLIAFHHIKPQCVVALVIYLYCKEANLAEPDLKTICSVCEVSTNNVLKLSARFREEVSSNVMALY
jgi:hypothetical protein